MVYIYHRVFQPDITLIAFFFYQAISVSDLYTRDMQVWAHQLIWWAFLNSQIMILMHTISNWGNKRRGSYQATLE